ncbi:hypothetical protein QTI51_23670 [Variovorax sp. J22G73]|jgi:hypothetical protein|uniref:hypothetical protein n=1 Tax=unclassified Variovorax TaxID=663243 RepID=UPI000D5D5FC2|nr:MULTISPECIES: hypothetical protein [unclassified Variovorax]MDM0008080.1 hypothetical protein [Variovorax sp. J22R203]MDM0100298.1 hypothetical protein [Variovorax sp. J22G73]
MLQWLEKHRVGFALSVLSMVALIGMFVTSGEKVFGPIRGTNIEPLLLALGWTNTIAFNLCLGYLTSVFFWLLVVHVPERQRRKLLRESLSRRYADFKHNTIQICSWAGNLQLSTMDVDELTEKSKFKDYFHRQRWYDVANGLEANQDYVDGLLLEMQLLADELTYILNNVVIQDVEVHGLFKQLTERVYRMKYDPNYTADPVKYICQFLWELHANWSFVVGYMPNDPVTDKIARV